MSDVPSDLLRRLVKEAVHEALETREGDRRGQPVEAEPGHPWDHLVTRGTRRVRTETVRLLTDEDLAIFTRQLLALFENPKGRADVRNGWLRFTLEGGGNRQQVLLHGGSTPVSSARRIDRGAVTERVVADAAAAGQHLVLAGAAVLTPLARDKAKALGVHIEKERQ